VNVKICKVGQSWSMDTGEAQHTLELELPNGALVSAVVSAEASQAIIELRVRGDAGGGREQRFDVGVGGGDDAGILQRGEVHLPDDGIVHDGVEDFGGDFGEDAEPVAVPRQQAMFTQPQQAVEIPSESPVPSRTVAHDEAGNPEVMAHPGVFAADEEDVGADSL